MPNYAYVNSQSNNGTCTATAPASGNGVTWNLCSLQVSQSGGSVGPNAKLTIYDGAVGGTVLYAAYLSSPGAPMLSAPGAVTGGLGGSVGIVQDIPLPKSPQGVPGVQASPGNALNIQVTGTGANNVSINARFSDGLP